ncbi:MAG: isoprenylcysteine carboxylmethyltransferase family protein [Cocleimonas sp.]
MKALELKIPPPVYAIIIGASMWWLNQALPMAHWIDSPWNNMGLVIIVLAIVLDSSSLYLFIKKQTTINPMRPTSTQGLVTAGLYQYTRNPMYVGLLTILLGYAVWLGSVTPFLVLPLFYWLITTMQIKPEERILEEKFGQEYLDYKSKVRRWL